MITVTFNYDPETNTVSDVTAVGADVKASAPKTAKAKKTKTSDKVILNGSSLQLNQDVLDLLEVKVGDRLCVRFNPGPVLVRPEVANEANGGNLITKSLTVSVKGKTSGLVAQYGSEFDYNKCSDGYVCLVTGDAEIADQTDTPIEQEINANIIDDSDFLTDLEDGEEIDFKIDI